MKEINKLISEYNSMPSSFDKKREEGVNESIICQLIRNDSLTEFETYTKSYNFDEKVVQSVFETNPLLNKSGIQLHEYAAFYGSVKILEFLYSKGAPLDKNTWIYAVHSNKREMIDLLAKLKIRFIDYSCYDNIKESFKCHHNELAKYLWNKYMPDTELPRDPVLNYNFEFIWNPEQFLRNFSMICHLDYYPFVSILLKENDIDVNQEIFKFN